MAKPIELLPWIGEYVLGPNGESICDCVSLAMTCQSMNDDIVRSLPNAQLPQPPMDWSGDRIICAGDSADVGDLLPPGVFTPSELAEYELPGQHQAEEDDDDWTTIHKTLSSVPHYAIGWAAGKCWGDEWDDEHRDYKHSQFFSETAFKDTFRKSRSEDPEPSNGILVVRNLTKHQYIRGDIVISKPQDPPFNRGPYTFVAQFPGEMAFYSMIWSSDTSFHNPPETSEMTIRGRWAGHRVDLVTVGEDAFDGLGELAGTT